MFGLLAGAEDEVKGLRYNVGTFGWSHGIVPEDTPAIFVVGGGETSLKKGTIVRVYVGKIPWSSKETIKTPGDNGNYLVEPAGGGYWVAYDNKPEAQALMQSPEYVAKLPALKKRMVAAKLAPKDLLPLSKEGGTSEDLANDALNAQGVYDPKVYEMDANGLPVLDKDGKPKRKGAGSDGNKPPPTKAPESSTGLLALLGVGALALLASRK